MFAVQPSTITSTENCDESFRRAMFWVCTAGHTLSSLLTFSAFHPKTGYFKLHLQFNLFAIVSRAKLFAFASQSSNSQIAEQIYLLLLISIHNWCASVILILITHFVYSSLTVITLKSSWRNFFSFLSSDLHPLVHFFLPFDKHRNRFNLSFNPSKSLLIYLESSFDASAHQYQNVSSFLSYRLTSPPLSTT